MFRVGIKRFVQYQSPQQYQEFLGKVKLSKTQKTEAPIDSMNRKTLTFRKVELEDYDFVTQSSDFDIERFSLKEYIWSCIFYRKRTLIRLILFSYIWSGILLVSKFIFMYTKKIWRKIAPVGYFGMVEPAYKDIELERFKQRLKFSILHKYD